MTQKQAIQLFEEKRMRTVWDTDADKWWFSVVDVVSVLMDSDYQTKYWKVLKGRQAKEGNKTITNCYQLNFRLQTARCNLQTWQIPNNCYDSYNLTRKY